MSTENQWERNPIIKLDLNSSNQYLYFFGARHTNDPADEQSVILKESFEEFLNKVKGEKIVFVEGATHEIPDDYNEAIHQYGEAGAINWLARRNHVEVVRPEPDEEEQRKSLCKKFDPNLVAYAFIVQNLSGWFRQITSTTFQEAINKVLKREAKFSAIYGFAPDKEWLEKEHKKLFTNKSIEDKDFLFSITDPRFSDSPVNNVVSARSNLRNEYLFSAITNAIHSEKSAFVVYGKGHLESLKGKLEDLGL